MRDPKRLWRIRPDVNVVPVPQYYPELARHVVRHNPDVIFAEGNQMLVVFKAATNTIPIVGPAVDPVGSGVVPSLARPGGNITGISPHFDIIDLEQARRTLESSDANGLQGCN
jgi:ABC-type uncharacterized transport system substrate-binding protein